MNLLYFTPLLLMLIVGVSQAEAYDGKIRIQNDESTPKSPQNGYVFLYNGFLSKAEPPQNSFVEIKLLDTDDSIIDSFQVNVDSQMRMIDSTASGWHFNFQIDTSKYNLLTDTRYIVVASFEDKTDEDRLFVFPPPDKPVSQDVTITKTSDESVDFESIIAEKDRRISELEAENLELQMKIEQLQEDIEFMYMQFAENIRLANEWFKSQLAN